MASKHLFIGVGGRKCVCCFPSPGSRARRLEYRAAKRRDNRDALRYEMAADPGDDTAVIRIYREETDSEHDFNDGFEQAQFSSNYRFTMDEQLDEHEERYDLEDWLDEKRQWESEQDPWDLEHDYTW